jgi:hypothetical protein
LYFLLKKLAKVSNCPKGENFPHLVTLIPSLMSARQQWVLKFNLKENKKMAENLI